MKKNTSLRLVCLFIAVLMTFCVFAACAKNNDDTPGSDTTTAAQGGNADNPSDTSGNSGDGTVVDSNLDENGFIKDNVPDDLNYNQTITLLYWSDREHEEFEVAEQTGDNVGDAIFLRNLTIEDRLGITMEFISTPGDSGKYKAWTTYVDTALQSGGGTFDVMAGYSLSIASNASNGHLYDLLDDGCEYLDFDMPWWPNALLDEATINDKLYFASGDISANALYMMYVTYVNTDIVEEHGLDNVFDLVDSNQWTYEKFIQMCTDVYIDQDGSGDKSIGDRFGYMSSGIHVDPWFYGTGALIVDKDANGNLQVSDSFSGERTIKALEMINTLLWNTNDGIYTEDVEHQREFNNGNLLFATDRARISITKLDSDDLHFSIVPFPKFDSAQENFVTVMGNPFSLYAIPIDAKEEELPMLSAYLETYASESYRQVTPQLFEVSLKVKYTQSNENAKMYDIIRESLTFDIGRIFSKVLIGQGTWKGAVGANSTNWASLSKGATKAMPRLLENLISAYEG
ncbi:MAG: carbohydrate ABC transporter substrate-binding protein [Clostridia bacterium]|nr:carbohydrate ABC transporter substrate-binding protein [Clostridia bacterium]